MNNQQLPLCTITLKRMACVLFSIAAIFVSCKKTVDKPTPTPTPTPTPILTPGFTFTANPDQVNVVTFEDTSKNAVSYYWNFGESSANGKDTSTKKICTYTYDPSSGTSFKVKLVVTDQNKKKDSITKTITITYPGQSDAAFDTLRFEGKDLGKYQFRNKASTPYTIDGNSITWNFGDGSPEVTRTFGEPDGARDKEDPIHIYTNSGTFTVTQTVTDRYNRSSTTTQTVHPNIITGIFIKKVNLIQMPDKDFLGDDYDATSGPDPYFIYSIDGTPKDKSVVVDNARFASWTTAIPLPLEGSIMFKFFDEDPFGADESIGYTGTFLSNGILKNSNDGIFNYIKDYSDTKQGGQLKISIEFDIQTQ